MNKAELRELAEWGVRRKLEAIERQLAVLYAEFPEVFIGDRAPMLVKAEGREEGNGWNGNMQSALVRSSAAKDAWTPERKAKASKAMKKRIAEGKHPLMTAKGKRKTAKKGGIRRGAFMPGGWKNKWYDRLETLGLDEKVGESAKALKTTSANLLTSSRGWLKAGVIKKTGLGTYAIGGPKPAEE